MGEIEVFTGEDQYWAFIEEFDAPNSGENDKILYITTNNEVMHKGKVIAKYKSKKTEE